MLSSLQNVERELAQPSRCTVSTRDAVRCELVRSKVSLRVFPQGTFCVLMRGFRQTRPRSRAGTGAERWSFMGRLSMSALAAILLASCSNAGDDDGNGGAAGVAG